MMQIHILDIVIFVVFTLGTVLLGFLFGKIKMFPTIRRQVEVCRDLLSVCLFLLLM